MSSNQSQYYWRIIAEKKVVHSCLNYDEAEEWVRQHEKLKLFDYGTYYTIRKTKRRNTCK